MKTKVLVGILVFLIVVNIAAIGSYIFITLNKPDKPEIDFTPPMPPNRAELNFTKEQADELYNLITEFKKSIKDKQKKTLNIENEVFELLQKDPVPVDDVNKKLSEIADLRLSISKTAIKNLIKAKEFLSPEQQEHFYNAILARRPELPGLPPPLKRDSLFGPPMKNVPLHRRPPGPLMK